jgi:hypothetical protein
MAALGKRMPGPEAAHISHASLSRRNPVMAVAARQWNWVASAAASRFRHSPGAYAPCNHDSGLFGFIHAAAENFRSNFGCKLWGKGGDIERQERPAGDRQGRPGQFPGQPAPLLGFSPSRDREGEKIKMDRGSVSYYYPSNITF